MVLELRYFFRTGCVVSGIMLATLALGSCNLAKNQLTFDRETNKDLQEYRDGLSPEHPAINEPPATLPDFQSVVSTPADLKLPSPLVTVSVDQTVSLHDLMFELAEQAGVDLEMDPTVHGSLIFTAKDRPFNDVVDRICEMAGLRYTFQNNVLRIELDRPYLKDYKVSYMSTLRSAKTEIQTGISNGGGGSGGGAGSVSNNSGSNSDVKDDNEDDFWKDLDAGLKQVLASADNYTALATQEDPMAVPEPAPPPIPPTPGQPGAKGAAAVPPTPSNLPPTLNISPAPAAPAAKPVPATYSFSKATGIVTVFATEREQKQVQKFLDGFRREAMTQVLIEAKVLEVQLNDQYSTGIDWGTFGANLSRLVTSGTATLPMQAGTSVFNPAVSVASATNPGGNIFSLNMDFGHGFHPVISALSQYGSVRALSSPRVTVMNNQPAVVNVAKNLVYFNVKVTTTPSTSPGVPPTISYDSQQESVPDGVLLNVTPTANLDTGEIMMAVRPTVSKEVDTVQDPSIQLSVVTAGLPTTDVPNSPTPEMSVQEIDSIVKMQSGQTVVMGGLMKDSDNVNQIGIPVLGDIPILGNLFHAHGDAINKTELVIFLRASIVPGSNVDDTDRKVYKQFSNDTHPLKM